MSFQWIEAAALLWLVWSAVATGLVARSLWLRRPGPHQNAWDHGFAAGLNSSVERFRRVPEDLRKATGSAQHHSHDVEVMVRRAIEEVSASRRS